MKELDDIFEDTNQTKKPLPKEGGDKNK